MTLPSRRARFASGVALALFLVLLALAGGARQVAAHANLDTADPAPNSELEESPLRVIIQFTEPLEGQFSNIKVLDADGERVDLDDSELDNTDSSIMSVSLSPLDNGTYTVSWTNVSTVDGHRVRGAYVFSVGEPMAAGAEPEAPPLLQSRADPYYRWLVLFGAMIAVGGLAFYLLVAQPALGMISKNQRIATSADAMSRRGEMAVAAGLATFLVASVLQLLSQTSVTFETSFWGAIGSNAGTIISDTDWGQIWAARAALIAVMILLLTASPAGRGRTLPGMGGAIGLRSLMLWAALLAGVSALYTLSLVSHGAGTTGVRNSALTSDLIHLIAASLWAGGLVQLLVGIPSLMKAAGDRELQRILMRVAPRFSALALVSGVTIVTTGLFGAWAQLATWRAFTTAYGYALIIKLALTAPLVATAGINLLWVRPRIADSARPAARIMRKLVVVEVAAIALLLVAVGYMTAMEPGRQIASREASAEGPRFTETSEGTTINVRLEHARTGPNAIVVYLTNQFDEPVGNADGVELILSGLDAGIPGALVRATDQGLGVWMTPRQLFSVAGEWQAEVIVRRPDGFDSRVAWRFDIGGTGSGGSALFAPDAATAKLLLGAEIAVLGLLIFGFSLPLGGTSTRAGLAVAAPGAAASFAGIAILAGVALSTGVNDDDLRNPFPPTAQSVSAGREFYGAVCATCHGDRGLGDGPAAPTLSSPPADLVVHVPLHGDDDLYRFVRDGIPGTPMKPLGDALTGDEMWHVVNYIRTIPRQ
jgi:copper transport protein